VIAAAPRVSPAGQPAAGILAGSGLS